MSSDRPKLNPDEQSDRFTQLCWSLTQALKKNPPDEESQLPAVVAAMDQSGGDGSGDAAAVTAVAGDSSLPSSKTLFDHAIESWAHLIGGNYSQFPAMLMAQAYEMVKTLESEGKGTEVERHFIEMVVLSRMQSLFWENVQAKAPDTSPEMTAYKLKKSEGAMRKWCRSLESLARIRSIMPHKVVMQQVVMADPSSNSPHRVGQDAGNVDVIEPLPDATARRISRTIAAIEQPKPKRLPKKNRSHLGSGSIEAVVAKVAGMEPKRRLSSKNRKTI